MPNGLAKARTRNIKSVRKIGSFSKTEKSSKSKGEKGIFKSILISYNPCKSKRLTEDELSRLRVVDNRKV